MAVDVVGFILGAIGEYGLFAIFVFLMLDAAMLLPLVPGELLMIMAVTRYASDQFTLALVVVFATLATTMGSLILYGIARGGGRRFVMEHPRLFFMSPKTRDRLERTFQKPWGQSLVFILRLFPLVRLLVNLPAGLARMPVMRFFVLTLLGNLVFHAGLMWLAFESRDPDSAVAARVTEVRQDYANPAWAFVETNWLLVAAVLVALGLVLSLRSSLKTARQPHGSGGGSLIGTLATAGLFWGGLGLVMGLWVDADLTLELVSRTGFDVRSLDLDFPYGHVVFAALIGLTAIALGLLISEVGRAAKRHAKMSRHRNQAKAFAPPAAPPATAARKPAPTRPPEPPRAVAGTGLKVQVARPVRQPDARR